MKDLGHRGTDLMPPGTIPRDETSVSVRSLSLRASVAATLISNRHPCRLETTLNPSVPTTAPFLIVTQMAMRKASPSRANPPWRMSRGTCFAPTAPASPRLGGRSIAPAARLMLVPASSPMRPASRSFPPPERLNFSARLCVPSRDWGNLAQESER